MLENEGILCLSLHIKKLRGIHSVAESYRLAETLVRSLVDDLVIFFLKIARFKTHQFKLNAFMAMTLSVQNVNFKLHQYQQIAVLPNLMLAKVTRYTIYLSPRRKFSLWQKAPHWLSSSPVSPYTRPAGSSYQHSNKNPAGRRNTYSQNLD